MSKLTVTKQNLSEVETPPAGQATLFLDAADDKWKVKLDSGTVQEVIYSSGGPAVDKNFVQAFVATDTIVVTHSLGKIPSVTVIDDSTSRSVIGEVEYDSGDITNKLTVRLSTPLTGKVVCN